MYAVLTVAPVEVRMFTSPTVGRNPAGIMPIVSWFGRGGLTFQEILTRLPTRRRVQRNPRFVVHPFSIMDSGIKRSPVSPSITRHPAGPEPGVLIQRIAPLVAAVSV